ncbi:MAG: hypothetical protein Q4D16_15340 [Eubacteriales bacterium]|nr:hypothetical protein [Eubacteriales bacterium]
MNMIKRQSAGSWITFITLVLAVVSLIVYNVNVNGDGYFQNSTVPKAVTYMIVTIVLLAAGVVMAQVNLNGTAGKILDLLGGAVKIAAPPAAVAAAMTLVSGRIEGFAFIYMSNEEVLHEVQTAANLSSAHGAIANIVLLAAAAVFGMAAAFFSLKKE